ncbi:MAG: hypothetical protein ACKVX7_12485 [Planctomycetota bacterium]
MSAASILVAMDAEAAAMDALIRGADVRRGIHELGAHVELFRARLVAGGFIETRVGDVNLGPEERVECFLLDGTRAVFGHVFWERFTRERARLIFGSVVRAANGDWAIILGRGSPRPIYVNALRRERWDSERPC